MGVQKIIDPTLSVKFIPISYDGKIFGQPKLGV